MARLPRPPRLPTRAAAAPAGSSAGRRPPRRWGLAGALLGGLLALIAQAPATWLGDALARASGERLRLDAASGTVWQGSAVPVLSGGPGSRDASALPDRLHWHLRWSGGPVLDLAQACCIEAGTRLRLGGGWDRLRLSLEPPPARAAETAPELARWPAAWLSGLGTPWNTLQAGGRLTLRSQALGLDWSRAGWQLEGVAVLGLQDLSARLSPLPRLGSYELQLAGEGPGRARLSLSTREGALQLRGDGHLGARGLRFRGEAEAAPGEEAALANLLNIIGRRQGARSVLAIG
ncbi:type II secretion system protein N [Aquariibacter albus]|uniref:Type II secretion system protein N n=1 Tax=Aquariibacter albus TaxID=2759899 RepID=A0A839HL30_9BURK|nr:type II secretion system protein N [Aquariibacter albus]MBB1162586.1 type II secretion system protein N [Aquariibacter albus]